MDTASWPALWLPRPAPSWSQRMVRMERGRRGQRRGVILGREIVNACLSKYTHNLIFIHVWGLQLLCFYLFWSINIMNYVNNSDEIICPQNHLEETVILICVLTYCTCLPQWMKTSMWPAMSLRETRRTTTPRCTPPAVQRVCTRPRPACSSCLLSGPRTCPSSLTFPSETRWAASAFECEYYEHGSEHTALWCIHEHHLLSGEGLISSYSLH